MKCFHTREDAGSYEGISSSKDYKFSACRKKTIKKRKRKSSDQLNLLFEVFKTSFEWDKETMAQLSKQTGLTEAQIYKWSWDQKKKIQLQDKLKTYKFLHLSEIFNSLPEVTCMKNSKEVSVCIDTNGLGCPEIITPRDIDFEMYYIQKRYRGCVENLQKGGLESFFEEIQELN